MAQNGVTISNFKAAPGTGNVPDTLTFDVQWSPPQPEIVWSDTVWVFVDYNNAGTMTRLPLALNAGATLTQHSAAGQDGAELVRLEEVPGNPHGVWVVGNARATQGAFTATVQLLLEETWRATSLHGLCVYAINYPPVGRYTAANQIKFNGTPPFFLTYTDESTVTVTKDAAAGTYTLKAETTLKSFTDASLAPGVIICKTPAQQTLTASAQEYCAGSGVTFALSNTDAGADYRLIKEGDSDAVALTGAGSAATFSGTFTAGTYHVETASGAFCPATLTSQVTVTEVALPTVPPTEPADQSACSGVTVTLTIQAQANVTYSWYNKATGTSLGTGASYATSTSGSYYAVATSDKSCTITSRTATVTLSGAGGALGNTPTTCGCAAGLATAPGCSYCMPSIPAATVTVNGLNGVTSALTTNFSAVCSCPSGWRTPTRAEYKHLYQNYASIYGNYANVNYMTSERGTCGISGSTCKVSCTSYLTWREHAASCCACGCGAANYGNGWDSVCYTSSTWLMKCVQ